MPDKNISQDASLMTKKSKWYRRSQDVSRDETQDESKSSLGPTLNKAKAGLSSSLHGVRISLNNSLHGGLKRQNFQDMKYEIELLRNLLLQHEKELEMFQQDNVALLLENRRLKEDNYQLQKDSSDLMRLLECTELKLEEREEQVENLELRLLETQDLGDQQNLIKQKKFGVSTSLGSYGSSKSTKSSRRGKWSI